MNEISIPKINILATTIASPELIPAGIKYIKADTFWDKGRKGEGRVIAIIDTGCDITHPDLSDRILDKKNFTSDNNNDINNVTDYQGHGTHVAGIIAANENKSGIIGVAPRAQLIILKALNASGGTYDALIKAIYYAISKKVDIISMSLSGKTNVPELETAIKMAISNNISVVCAAGNSGDGSANTIEIDYPAAYNSSISVGSVNINNITSRFSNSNYQIDLLAPGEGINNTGIYSTAPGGKYVLLRGTSMACPHVAGALALIKNWAVDSFKRELSEEEIYAQLIKMTQSLGLPKSLEGNGILNLIAR